MHKTLRARATNDRAIELFEQALESESPVESLYSLKWINHAATIQRLSRDGVFPAYQYLKTEVVPDIERNGSDVPDTLRNVAKKLLSIVVARKRVDSKAKGMPELIEIVEVNAIFADRNAGAWLAPVKTCLEHIAAVDTSVAAYESTAAHRQAMAGSRELLREVVRVWESLSRLKAGWGFKAGDGEGGSGFLLGSPFLPARVHVNLFRTTKGAFRSLFSQVSPNQFDSHGGSASLLATYALLTDPMLGIGPATAEGAPLVEAVAEILTKLGLKKETAELLLQDQEKLKPYVLSRLPAIMKDIREGRASTEDVSNPTVVAGEIHRKLKAAFETKNADRLGLVWKEMEELGRSDVAFREELKKRPGLLDYLVHIWCSLGDDEKLRATMAFTSELGMPTTARTLTSMIQGWKRIRRIDHIERLWQTAILDKGLKLDKAIWTARISTLMDHGRPDDGVRALTEMRDLWKAAEARGDPDSAVRPTIEPVNAVLAGLVRLQRAESLTEILDWAAREGIEPDVVTFNTLLRPLLRAGRVAEADRVLEAMREQGVRPDPATITIMSEAALAAMADQTADEQAQTLERVFSVMRRAGIAANMKIYAKMVHALLRGGGDGAEKAVGAVLAHIRSRGWRPSPHIYTMLVSHHFARDPLDVAAVRALTRRMEEEEERKGERMGAGAGGARSGSADDGAAGGSGEEMSQAGLDRVFWLRVVKGYGMAGELEDAMRIFGRLAASGARIDPQDVEPLLRLLVARERWDEARTVVRTVAGQGRGKGADGGERDERDDGRRWRHQFWHLADQYGLLEGIEAPIPLSGRTR